MTRSEIERDYDVVDGCITSLGRFEGEMVYVPYFWDSYLDGCADDDDDDILSFDVTPEDREKFPELGDKAVVRLYERDDGFVCEC